MQEFEKGFLYLRSAKAVKVPVELLGYLVEWEKDEYMSHADGAGMHLARLDV